MGGTDATRLSYLEMRIIFQRTAAEDEGEQEEEGDSAARMEKLVSRRVNLIFKAAWALKRLRRKRIRHFNLAFYSLGGHERDDAPLLARRLHHQSEDVLTDGRRRFRRRAA